MIVKICFIITSILCLLAALYYATKGELELELFQLFLSYINWKNAIGAEE